MNVRPFCILGAAAALLLSACDVAVLYRRLHYDNGLVFTGKKGGEYRKLDWGVSNQSDSDRSLPSSLEIEIGETTLNLLNMDRERLQIAGLKWEEQGSDEKWYREFSNGDLLLRYDKQGNLLWLSYQADNLAQLESASTNVVRFKYKGKSAIELPMSEKEVKEYFGSNYRIERVRGLEF